MANIVGRVNGQAFPQKECLSQFLQEPQKDHTESIKTSIVLAMSLAETESVVLLLEGFLSLYLK